MKLKDKYFLVENINRNDLCLTEGENFFILDPNQDITKLNLSPICRLFYQNI
jgi:hypothetical protein